MAEGRVEPAKRRTDLRQEIGDEVLQPIPVGTGCHEQATLYDALITDFHAVNLLDAQLIISQG